MTGKPERWVVVAADGHEHEVNVWRTHSSNWRAGNTLAVSARVAVMGHAVARGWEVSAIHSPDEWDPLGVSSGLGTGLMGMLR